jgi:hypothetical protein
VAGSDTSVFNGILLRWKNTVRRSAISNVLKMSGHGKAGAFSKILTHKTEGKLAQSIQSNTRKDYGEISMVGFDFPRHGVFFHHGVGRGWERIGGKVVRTAKGPMKAARIPKNWINSEIDRTISKLADDLVMVKADAVVKATRVKIN